MPKMIDDFHVAGEFAILRWGHTGFLCDECACTSAYRCRTRPRVFECRECGHQQSVTAGTAMHGTKLPLEVWRERIGWHELGLLPTSRGFARDFDIAPSTAWHVNQRFFACVDGASRRHLPMAGYLLAHVAWRRPQGPPLPESAPAALRASVEAFGSKRAFPPFRATICFGFEGREAVLVDLCPTPEEHARMAAGSEGLVGGGIVNRGVERYVSSTLEDMYGTVSLRWGARYIRYVLSLWNVGREHVRRRVPAFEALVAWPARSLRVLREQANEVCIPPPIVPRPPRLLRRALVKR